MGQSLASEARHAITKGISEGLAEAGREIQAERLVDSRDELSRILNAEAMTDDTDHPMTKILDMLAGLAEELSQLEGDRWEQIAHLIQGCAGHVEHHTGEDAPESEEGE